MERLELVTDFATLRCGMIVVIKECDWCSRSHRMLLISLVSGRARDVAGTSWNARGWTIQPQPNCTGRGKPMLLVPKSVDERKVYRVVDDEITQVSTPVTRKKPVTA